MDFGDTRESSFRGPNDMIYYGEIILKTRTNEQTIGNFWSTYPIVTSILSDVIMVLNQTDDIYQSFTKSSMWRISTKTHHSIFCKKYNIINGVSNISI